MPEPDQTSSAVDLGGGSIRRRTWGRRLFQRSLILLCWFLLLVVVDWSLRGFRREVYAAYGRYYLLAANVFCAVTWIWLVARISRHWRELKPAGFRYGSLALLLAAGVLWSGVLAADLFSFYGRDVSVDEIVPSALTPLE